MENIDTQQALEELFTIRDFIRWSVTQFSKANLVFGHGTDNGWSEALSLVLSSLHLPPDVDLSVLDARLTREEKIRVLERIELRVVKKVPVPYLINEAWFCGYSFYVDQRVIIPRSPIAELIEDEFKPWVASSHVERILDLCTGSACIAISCALTFPNATVDAIDISQDALDVAAINCERMDVEDCVSLIKSDMFDALENEKYDIIISNPPYVAQMDYEELPEEFKHEPEGALVAGQHGLDFVKRILCEARQFLSPKGVLIVEVGYLQDLIEEEYPDVAFTWLQFEQGGEGVFLLTAEELAEFKFSFDDKA